MPRAHRQRLAGRTVEWRQPCHSGYRYRASACSTACFTSAESGVTAGSNRRMILPSLPMRILVKFHLMSPPVSEVRYWYSGTISPPFTDTLLIIGNVTLYLRLQNVLISSLLPGS